MTTSVTNQYRPIPAGVNIQIFNPVATPCMEYGAACNCHSQAPVSNPCYPVNYYTQDFSKTSQTTFNNYQAAPQHVNVEQKTPTNEKKLVKITDEYIKKLESYLDSQDVEKRILASKDILERVQEDDSRKDNAALTALTNKMLKDPYQPIRFLALGILEDRQITGNAETVEILRKVEKGRYSKQGNVDADAIKASNVLLKMTRKVEQ